MGWFSANQFASSWFNGWFYIVVDTIVDPPIILPPEPEVIDIPEFMAALPAPNFRFSAGIRRSTATFAAVNQPAITTFAEAEHTPLPTTMNVAQGGFISLSVAIKPTPQQSMTPQRRVD